MGTGEGDMGCMMSESARRGRLSLELIVSYDEEVRPSVVVVGEGCWDFKKHSRHGGQIRAYSGRA